MKTIGFEVPEDQIVYSFLYREKLELSYREARRKFWIERLLLMICRKLSRIVYLRTSKKYGEGKGICGFYGDWVNHF